MAIKFSFKGHLRTGENPRTSSAVICLDFVADLPGMQAILNLQKRYNGSVEHCCKGMSKDHNCLVLSFRVLNNLHMQSHPSFTSDFVLTVNLLTMCDV